MRPTEAPRYSATKYPVDTHRVLFAQVSRWHFFISHYQANAGAARAHSASAHSAVSPVHVHVSWQRRTL